MCNTVAIVGSHPGTRGEFDFGRTDCDIWLFNEAISQPWAKRADIIFQLHAPVIWLNPKNRNDGNHYYWLTGADGTCQKCDGNGKTDKGVCSGCDGTGVYRVPDNRKDVFVMMQEAFPEVINSRAFPREDIKAEILKNFNGGQEYYTSSPAFAIAMAVYSGYKRIEIYGVEMETDTEYRFQRDSVAFWVGVAVGRGIEVELHSRQFLTGPVYGYEGDVQLSYDLFADRVKILENELAIRKAEYDEHRKTMDDALMQYRIYGSDPDHLAELYKAQIDKIVKYGFVDGAVQENKRYLKKADIMKRASGGDFIFVRQEFEQAMTAIGKKLEEQRMITTASAIKVGELFDGIVTVKNKDKRSKRLKELVAAMNVYIIESQKLGIFMGALDENQKFLTKLTELIRAAGGSKSEEAILSAERSLR